MVLDKTDTITQGQPTVTDYVTVNGTATELHLLRSRCTFQLVKNTGVSRASASTLATGINV